MNNVSRKVLKAFFDSLLSSDLKVYLVIDSLAYPCLIPDEHLEPNKEIVLQIHSSAVRRFHISESDLITFDASFKGTTKKIAISPQNIKTLVREMSNTGETLVEEFK